MNNLTINLRDVSDEDKKILMEIVERSKAPKDKAWKPKLWDVYYAIDPDGEITQLSYDSDYDEDILSMGNGFRTKAEAEFEVERRKFLKKWKDLSIESGEPENEWDNTNKHWSCYYDTMYGGLSVRCTVIQQDGAIYFSNKESLNNAIKKLGAENVKKYILGVKE